MSHSKHELLTARLQEVQAFVADVTASLEEAAKRFPDESVEHTTYRAMAATTISTLALASSLWAAKRLAEHLKTEFPDLDIQTELTLEPETKETKENGLPDKETKH